MIDICFPFFGDSIGGSQISSLEIYKNLKKYKKIVYILHSKGIFYDYLKKKKINFYYLPINIIKIKNIKLAYIVNIFINFFKIFNFLMKNKISNIHGNTTLINIIWAVPVLFFKTKYIWHQRQFFSKSFFWSFVNFFVDTIIANSKNTYKSIPQNVSKKKKFIIENAFSIKIKKNKNKFNSWIKKKIKERKKYFLIGYVGRVIKDKKVHLILEALNIMPRVYKDCFFLVICGKSNSDYKKKLLDKIEKYKLKNTLFISHTNNISKVYSSLDMTIMTSPNEPFGRTIRESMAYRTIVLASNCLSHKDQILDQQNGFLFKSKNIEDLKKKMIKIYKYKNKKNIINNAIKYCRTLQIEKKEIIKKLLAIYN